MITFYKTGHDGIEQIEQPEPGCWIDAYAPSEQERSWLEDTLQISTEFLSKAFDEEETAHTDLDPDTGQVLVIIDCPFIAAESTLHGKTIAQYDTRPVTFILIPEQNYLVTLSLQRNDIIEEFAQAKCADLNTAAPTQFMLKALFAISEAYLGALRVVNRQIHDCEKLLRKRITDSDLLTMLDIEKSLIYFTTSLQGLSVTISHVEFVRTIGIDDDDAELLDDVKIEIAQASEMCKIYTDILEGITDAYSNVLNNNLNSTMRILTCITIILAMPTIIFSFFGMNVDGLPLIDRWWYPIALSAIAAVVAYIVLKYNKRLR